jgi:hypothetical protein
MTNGDRSLCTEVLRIFAEGNKSTLLRLVFREQEGWQVGYPQTGVVWSTEGATSYNLNRPAVVSSIIGYAVPEIWDPDTMQSITVDDAIPILGASNAPTGTPTSTGQT